MTHKIFKSMLVSILIVLFASVFLIIASVNNYLVQEWKNILVDQTDLAAAGVEISGDQYLETLRSKNYRVTWVDTDGTVLFDNEENTSSLSNHSDREEIAEAFQKGTGSSERYSETLGQVTMYYAEKLSDNTVIRLSVTRNSLWLMLLKMITPFLWILLAAVIISVLLARRTAYLIVNPLNHLNLDEPLKNQGYEEIQPLLTRLDQQNQKIKDQLEELHQKQKEFNTVTNAIEEGLLLFNAEGKLLSYNPAAADFFHMESDQDSIPDEAMTYVYKALDHEHEDGVITLSDRKIHIDAGAVHSHGKTTGAAVLVNDITEQYEAEQIRREFTANVSHELKTPLQSIMGYSELLENHFVKEEDKDVFYKKIHQESCRLLALIDDIIRLSQLDEDTPLQESDLNVKDIVNEAIEALQDSAKKYDVSVHTDLKDVSVHANARLLYEIVYNLTDNAIRYNHKGGNVTVSTDKQDDHVILKVKDTGIGIAQKDITRIFERFYRVDKSHSRATGGTGLGLSIVKHAVRKCHARIQVNSRLHEGTEFSIIF